jgi:hypothetical protein
MGKNAWNYQESSWRNAIRVDGELIAIIIGRAEELSSG